MTAIVVILIGVGVFQLVAALMNWDAWFVDRESRIVEAIGGESVVRWLWGISGIVLIIVGIVLLAKG